MKGVRANMRFFNIDSLTKGMVLARDINYFDTEKNTMSKVQHSEPLTDAIIARLKKSGVEGAYIAKVADTEKMEHTISEEVKTEAVKGIQELTKGFIGGNITNEQIDSVNNTAESLVTTISSNKDVMVNILDLKKYDDYTYHHSLSVSVMSMAIGMEMGLSKPLLKDLVSAALLHDIGKIAIPITIISKPSRLTSEEFEIVKRHPVTAAVSLMKRNFVSENTFRGIISHHEKWDGTGYPNGLEGEDIPIFGRILAVADVYDALTSNRPYRKPAPPNEVIEYIMGNSGTHFDVDVVSAFTRRVAPFPVGAHVILSNKEVAVVLRNYPDQPLRPLVAVAETDKFYDLYHDEKCLSITVLGVVEQQRERPPVTRS